MLFIIYIYFQYVDNILVHQKVIKLASFGLPSVTFKESSNAFLFDIIPYMDPKSFNTKDYELGNHSDVYSVGVLLWQISSGCQPFRTGGYNANLATAILSGQREDIIDKTPLEYSKLYTGNKICSMSNKGSTIMFIDYFYRMLET